MIELFTYDHSIAMLLGVAIGAITGMLPGVGILACTIAFLPLLSTWSAEQIILWYITTLVTEQWTGSVVATYLAIPGKTSHWPAVIEGHNMFKNKRGPEAINAAAFGHIIAMIVALLLLMVIASYSPWIGLWFTTKLQAILMIAVLIAMYFITPKDSHVFKILSIIFGIVIGSFGDVNRVFYNADIGIHPYLNFSEGVTMIPLLVGIYALPIMFSNRQIISNAMIQNIGSKSKTVVKNVYNWITAILHSCIGFVFGFTPGLTVDMASDVSYNIQRYWQKLRKTYNKDGDVSCLIASESATNTSAISSVVPLMLFGIPITVSEGLVYSLLLSKGYMFSINTYNSSLMPILVANLLVVGILDYILSGPLSRMICNLYLYLKNWAIPLIAIILISSTLYNGLQNYQFNEYLFVLILSSIIGFTLRAHNFYLFVFTVMMSSHTVESFYRLWYIINGG